MRPLTNLQVFGTLIFIGALVGLGAFAPSLFADPARAIEVVAILSVVAVLVTSGFLAALRRVGRVDNFWSEPVSERTGATLIAIVVSVWLCAVGAIVFVVLSVGSNSPLLVGVTILSLVAAAVLGKYLRKRISKTSILAYGISFTGAITIIVFAFALTGK